MWVIRHRLTGKYVQAQSSMNKFGVAPRIFPTLSGLKTSILAYVKDNEWRLGYDIRDRDQLMNELEVCEVEIVPKSAVPAREIIRIFEEELERKRRGLPRRELA